MQPDVVVLFAVIVSGFVTTMVMACAYGLRRQYQMRSVSTVFLSAVVLCCLAAAGLMTPVFANHQAAAVIEQALGGAAPELAKDGTVLDQKGDLLQEGDNGWTRVRHPARFPGIPPMCNDRVWMEWAGAHPQIQDYAEAPFGVCYMLAGNIDP